MDKVELINLVAAARREQPRNLIVLRLCDAVEQLLTFRVPRSNEDKKQYHRDYMRAYMRSYRAKLKTIGSHPGPGGMM